MATVLGLAMKITADASGLQKSLTPVDRALQKLGEQASASSALFDKFLGSTTGASAAQRQFATDVAFLTSELKRGLRTPQEFAAEFERLQAAARGTADAFAEGQRLTEQFATAQERQSAATQRLAQLYELGAIGLETYNRASIEALGINEQAARSEQQRASFSARAAQLQEQARSPLERYDATVRELVTHLNAGGLSQQQFNTLVSQATQVFVRAESAAKGYDVAVQQAGNKGNLAFNELAGTLAILPGPIGNVAGRLSGISSAAEGLNRIFSNGGGIGQFGVAIAGLVNPATLALGALAGLGAGAVAVGRNLVQLEGEMARLGILADQLGASFGFIQVLENAALREGVGVESLGASFTKFLRTLDDARQGGKNAAEAFRDLGVSAEDVRSSNPEQLFTQAAQSISKIDDPARRAAVAVALFGKSGADLLPVFRQIGAAAADIERIGGAITDQQRSDLDAFGDAMDRLGVASTGLRRQVFANFAGIGKAVADNTAETIGSLNQFLKSLDDTANDRTWLGFQKSAERLKFDREILASREQVNKAAQESSANAAIAELVSSLGLAADGSIQLSGDLEKAQAQAAALGNNGTKAFLAFVKSLEDVAASAEGAGLSEEQLARAVAASRAEFERQIALLDEEADAQTRAAEAAKKAAEDRVRAAERLAEADRQRADAFIRQNGFGDENEAAQNLLAITRQIDEAETAIVQARAKGDIEAEKAALRRLQILDQAQAAAQDTLDFGFNAADVEQAIRGAQGGLDAVIAKVGQFGDATRKAADELKGGLADAGITIDIGNIGDRFGQAGVQAGLEFQRGLDEAKGQLDAKLIDPRAFDAAVQKQQQLFDDRIQRLGEIRDLELQIIEERAGIEEERIAALRRASQEPLVLNDIRTQEGASEFVRLATGREDPAIEEYRKQLDQLKKLENKLDRLAAVPVEIMGG